MVLITGAANGLGRALAIEFACQGWQVVATDIDRKALESLKDEPGIHILVMDVTSGESVHEVFTEVKNRFGSLELIINNAGIARYFPFSEAPAEAFREVFEINLFGAYRVNQTFLPIVKSPGGRILHIGSESYHLTVPFMPYPLTKRALESYAKVLRQELRYRGIDVVVIRPGPIRTRIIGDLSGIRYPVSDRALSEAFQQFAESVPHEVSKVISPEVAAQKIYRISRFANPGSIYRINNSLRLRLASLLPFRFLEKAIRRKLA